MRYQFGEFVFDLGTGELQQGKAVVPLRRQSLRLLQVLVEAAPSLLTRDHLLDEVWGRSELSPNALPQAISELRRALGDDADAPRYIDTRRGLGYRFMAPVLALDEPQNESEPVPAVDPGNAAMERPARAPLVRMPPLQRVAAGVLALLIGLGTIWMLLHSGPTDTVAEQEPQKVGLAIAPFPADPAVAEWVPHAALELLSQALRSDRMTLYRSDTLGVSTQGDPVRAQHQAYDLLGASHGLSGRWRLAASGPELQLDLSIVDLATGQILASQQFKSAGDDLDRLIEQASDLIADTLRVAVSHRVPGKTRLVAADRNTYWSALSALARDDPASAASALAALHEKLGKPAWIEPDLARALALAEQRSAAQVLLETRLQRGGPLPLGERLRIQAELAGLRHKPAEAAAAHRALVELYPDDVENWIDLVDAELDALQGASARTTMAQLDALPQARIDPRMHLLRARLSMIDNDYEQARAEAAAAMQQAVSHELPAIAIDAALTHSDSLSLQGEVAEAAEYLGLVEQEWSSRASGSDRFALHMRRIKLLRTSGDLSSLPAMLEQVAAQAISPTQRLQWGIEQALLQSAQGQHDSAQETIAALKQLITDAVKPALRISWHDARAVISLGRNEIDLAREEFDAAFALARRMGQERFSAPLQVNAGMLLARQRRFVEADELWNSALETFTKLEDRRGQATCLGNLAASASVQGRPELSRELNRKALALFRELGIADAQARIAYNLALEAARFGNIDSAVELFAEARSAWLAGAQNELAIRAAVGEAEVTLLQARPEAARRILDTFPVSAEFSALGRASLRAVRARLALAQGKAAEARLLEEEALALRKQSGNEAWTALSELELLRLDWLQGAEATTVHVRAEALARRFTELKEVRDAARAWLLVAEAQLSLGRQSQALSAIEQVQKGLNDYADRPLELDLAWVSAWAAPPAERRVRLDTLRSRALGEGYLLNVAMIDAALAAPTAAAPADDTLQVLLPRYARRD